MLNDVLIVGAGPSGLFAACELARHGVSVRLVERDLKPHREARATAEGSAENRVTPRCGIPMPLRLGGLKQVYQGEPWLFAFKTDATING